jgi:hypothetical protein
MNAAPTAAGLIGGAASLAVLGGLTGAGIGASIDGTPDSKNDEGTKGAGIFAAVAVSAGIGIGGALIAATDVGDALANAGRSTSVTRLGRWGTLLAGTAAYAVPTVAAAIAVHRVNAD